MVLRMKLRQMKHLHEIIEMTNKVWDYHDAQQQKLLETRESLNLEWILKHKINFLFNKY